VACRWTIGHVRREALDRREAGALADEQDDDLWIEKCADLVEDSHPTVMDGEGAADFPAALGRSLRQERHQRRNLRRNRIARGNPLADQAELTRSQDNQFLGEKVLQLTAIVALNLRSGSAVSEQLCTVRARHCSNNCVIWLRFVEF